MSGETQANASGLTVDTLKLLVDQAIAYEAKLAAERDVRYDQRFLAQEAATKYSQEKANEFRGALSDLSGTMATRHELEAMERSVNEKIDILAQASAARAGQSAGTQATVKNIYAAIGAAVAVISLIVLLANRTFS